jgi:hypothetical protein
MNDFALILCVMAGIVATVAAISLCIAMMLWMIGLFGVGFEAVCRSFVVMTISVGVFAASEMMIGDI